MFYTFIIDKKKKKEEEKFELEYAYVEEYIPSQKIEEKSEEENESGIIVIDMFW